MKEIDKIYENLLFSIPRNNIGMEYKYGFQQGIALFKKAIDRLPPTRPEVNWILCKEQMPPAGNWAIWCSKKGLIQVARWKEDAIDHFWPSQEFFQLEDAVAWMPLPKPYSEKE